MTKKEIKEVAKVYIAILAVIMFILLPLFVIIGSGDSLSDVKGERCDWCGFDREITCLLCGGDGTSNCTDCVGLGFSICYKCHGQGEIMCTSCMGIGQKFDALDNNVVIINCEDCGGDGKTDCKATIPCHCGDGEATCSVCEGTGIMTCPKCKSDTQ